MAKNKKTKIKGGYFHNGKGKQFTVLQDALANDTKCGCGINCKDGFVSLPSFDSVSGDKEGFHGFYFVDGELVTDTVQNIKEDIKSFCNGGGQEPQALRLTFNSIESANNLVGDASNVNDWNTFFDLPAYGNPFTSVEINGDVVSLFGGSNIKVKPALMYGGYGGNQFLIEINDLAGSITSVGGDAFSYINTLTTVNLPACTIVYGYNDSPESDVGGFGYCENLTNLTIPLLEEAESTAFESCTSLITFNFPNLTIAGDSCFRQCISLTTVNFPILTTIGNSCFVNCASLTSVNFPILTSIGNACFSQCISLTSVNFPILTSIGFLIFNNCNSLTTINLPSCIDLGGTVGDNNVFFDVTGNTITLTIPAALMTADSGNPDGDIVYLQANNTVTVVTV